jgi:hypothetical protein
VKSERQAPRELKVLAFLISEASTCMGLRFFSSLLLFDSSFLRFFAVTVGAFSATVNNADYIARAAWSVEARGARFFRFLRCQLDR